MRLDKFLVECGIGSRTEVKKILGNGQVKVNGVITKSSKEQIDEIKDKITCKNEELEYKEFRYYVMHKPSGYITAIDDYREKTVMEVLPEWVIRKDLFPVGRLDKDTEGLLLFTNNGRLSHELLSPKKHVDKIYEVHLRESISDENIKKLESGVIILDNYFTKEAKVNKVEDKIIELTITEGKYHQVKEMLKAVGNEVFYLKRLSFGKLELGNLKKGEVIEISLEDIE
ncbi:MAG: rRNA pseudouridine synthase [Fusobacteriaceae bacterium]|jgi:16S rRNA pseudouridine516 synthase|nr:rRNA pseudouridine synthase [Fusobacteriaceae bacterium]